jgi:hypothetical protein
MPSDSKYNPEIDYRKGFNAEPIVDGAPVTDAQKAAALKKVQDLIDKTKNDLGR